MRSLTGHRHPTERADGADAPEPDAVLLGMVGGAPASRPRRWLGAAIAAVLISTLGGGLLLATRTTEDRAVQVGAGLTAETNGAVAVTTPTPASDVGAEEPARPDIGDCNDVASAGTAATAVATGAGCGPIGPAGYVVDTAAWERCLALHGVALTDRRATGEPALPMDTIRAASNACRAERPSEMDPRNDYERCLDNLGLFALPPMAGLVCCWRVSPRWSRCTSI